jgi:FAD synthetase
LKEKRDVATSLASISYAEGLLDAIRLLKLVDFNWNRAEKKDTGINLNKTVLATGAFDLLHYGHLKFLQESKKAGGKLSKLVVVVARDETVKERKGTKPVLPENQRRTLVEAMKPVDTAILGSKDFSIDDIIKKVQPDIITVGYDQEDMRKMVERVIGEHGWKIKIVQIEKFGRQYLNSSTKIKKKIAKDLR